MTTQLDWYIDFISPYPYIQMHRFSVLPAEVVVNPRPVLFAALLAHWGNKGPVEIPPKKEFFFRHLTWLANREGIALRVPPVHPFNPLRILRLAIALGSGLDVVREILRFTWAEGRNVNEPQDWADLTARLGLEPDEADEWSGRAEVKEALRINTEQAIAAGVFGVPTLGVGGALFWGADATDFALDCLRDPALLDRIDRQVARLP